ncbi:MAG TPA: hypothetical protein PLY88_00385 [Candidatus Omnitrophota bacterium]|nr:hypothetical protein [Candidatus Omnitrophota bacterium]
MKLFHPSKIYIEKGCEKLPFVKDILKRFPKVPSESAEHASDVYEKIKTAKDPWVHGKKMIFLARDQGRSFKPFPEAEDYFSCDYHSLHLQEGCDMECSYCILQSYLTNPLLMIYANIDEILENLQAFLNRHPKKFFRIGTGHLSDSLSLDHITHTSKTLIPFFAKQKNSVLELKTKSNNIDNLLELDPNGKVIVSWSINASPIQKEEEHKCASIEERLAAASKIAATDGYRVGFHFDPMIDFEDWEEEYEATVKKIAAAVPAHKIAWISIGSLRMMPDLKKKMQDRFPKSKLPYGEWINGMDGKLRYFKHRRLELYKGLAGMLEKYLPGVTSYLIMESPEVWRRVYGKEFTKKSICEMLDQTGSAVSAR